MKFWINFCFVVDDDETDQMIQAEILKRVSDFWKLNQRKFISNYFANASYNF